MRNPLKKKKDKSKKTEKKTKSKTPISPREIAKKISKGIIPKQHIGKKTLAVLQQELFSLKNEYNPKTMTNKEFEKWSKKYNAWLKDAIKLEGKDLRSIRAEAKKMLEVKI